MYDGKHFTHSLIQKAARKHRRLHETSGTLPKLVRVELLACLQALCDAHPALRVILHASEEQVPSASTVLSDRRLRVWRGPQRNASRGDEQRTAAFWSRALRPGRLRGAFELVWLFEPTLLVHPSVLPLAALAAALRATGAVAIQPLVMSQYDLTAESLGTSTPVPRASTGRGESSECAVLATSALDRRCVLFDMRTRGWDRLHLAVLDRIAAGVAASTRRTRDAARPPLATPALPLVATSSSLATAPDDAIADVACPALQTLEERMAARRPRYTPRPSCLIYPSLRVHMRHVPHTMPKENGSVCRLALCSTSAQASNPVRASCEAVRSRFADVIFRNDSQAPLECWVQHSKRGLQVRRLLDKQPQASHPRNEWLHIRPNAHDDSAACPQKNPARTGTKTGSASGTSGGSGD